MHLGKIRSGWCAWTNWEMWYPWANWEMAELGCSCPWLLEAWILLRKLKMPELAVRV